MKCSELIEQTDHLIQSGDSNRQSDQDFGEKLLDKCLSLRGELDLSLSNMQGKLGVPWSSPARFSFWGNLDDSISQTFLRRDRIPFSIMHRVTPIVLEYLHSALSFD